MKMSKYHEHVVPALDMLIGDPDTLRPDKGQSRKAKILHIPKSYVYQLHKFRQEQSGRGEACSELASLFSMITEYIHNNGQAYVCKNGMQIKFEEVDEKCIPKESTIDSAKGQAIAVARYLQREGKDVAIMTGDDLTATYGHLNNIDIEYVNPEVYTGRRVVTLPDEFYDIWYSEYCIKDNLFHYIDGLENLHENEFIEFYLGREDHTFSNIGRYTFKRDDSGREVWGIYPLTHLPKKDSGIWPRNAGQAMLYEALMMPASQAPIVIVSGIYGTGKTFIACHCGLMQSEDGYYEGIFICPRDGSLGKEIGFLPGDANTKIRAKCKPIEDNVRAIMKLRSQGIKDQKGKKYNDNSENSGVAKRTLLDKRVNETLENYFEYEALITMGGRSISDRFIIYDEFQDMERYQAKALLTRVGERSKMVILGDPNQRTNPHMSRTSNGLSYSATKLGGTRGVFVVTLEAEEIVRSDILRDIAAKLEHR